MQAEKDAQADQETAEELLAKLTAKEKDLSQNQAAAAKELATLQAKLAEVEKERNEAQAGELKTKQASQVPAHSTLPHHQGNLSPTITTTERHVTPRHVTPHHAMCTCTQLHAPACSPVPLCAHAYLVELALSEAGLNFVG